nr:lysylphosphatidylglycerol synthase transmembrane domain-containing protein [bacterium]
MANQRPKKKWLSILYLALNVIVLLVIALTDDSITQIWSALASLKPLWLVMCGLSILAYLFFGCVSCYLCARPLCGDTIDFKKSLRIGLMGKYYNAITPFGGGGQPFQIYYMHLQGADSAASAAALILKYVMYELVLGFFCIIGFIYYGGHLKAQNPLLFWAAVLGFIIAVGLPLIIIALSRRVDMLKRLCLWAVGRLAKWRILKHPENAITSISTASTNMQRALDTLNKQPRMLIPLILSSIGEMAGYYLVVGCLYRAFGLTEIGWGELTAAALLLNLATSYFPTPGASGASEGAFSMMFRSIFHAAAFSAMLLWRFFTYFFVLTVGAVIVFTDATVGIRGRAKPMDALRDAPLALSDDDVAKGD